MDIHMKIGKINLSFWEIIIVMVCALGGLGSEWTEDSRASSTWLTPVTYASKSEYLQWVKDNLFLV